MHSNNKRHNVVIVGGGFGGLYAAKALKDAPVNVTLIDRRNFHLFQPLLYQVATGGLSPGDIASPLRAVLQRQKNVRVSKDEVIDVVPDAHKIMLKRGEISYDSLVIATGVSHHYFGNEGWDDLAPGLKTIEDALTIRRRILSAFEAAEWATDPAARQAWLTFVIVGAGPTGVELAGALAELAHNTLKDDFRQIDPTEAKIILIEATDRVLPPYPAKLSTDAADALRALGVTVQTDTMVTDITERSVTVKHNEAEENTPARTVLWAAGMKASAMGNILAERTGVELDRAGRVMVEPDLSINKYPDIFVIGDLAHYAHQDGKPLPGVAPVAMQQGRYVARLIKARIQSDTLPAFNYRDKGSLAVVGRNAGVADFGRIRFAGSMAWLAWLFIHIWFLIGYDNKLVVLIQWAWNYFTRKRGARLITNDNA